MPEQRITDVVRPLRVQLDKARSFAADYEKDDGVPSSFSIIDKLIEDVNGEIRAAADIFRQLEIWEKDMKDKFGDIAKNLDKALEHGSDNNKFPSKLLDVLETASGFKESITNDSPLDLERLEAYVKSVSPSEPSVGIDNYWASTDTFEESELQVDITEEVIEMAANSQNIENSSHMQILLFLTIFPIGSLIKFKTIYHWSVGKHIVDDEVGLEIILGELSRRGIVKRMYKEYRPGVTDYCMLNPIVPQVLLNTALFRRTFLRLQPEPSWPRSKVMCDMLKTYCNVDRGRFKFRQELFDRRDDIEIVMLGRWHNSAKHHIEVENVELVRWLGSFKHLGYLSLRGISRITELPPEIGDLKSLLVLDLRACYDLQRLPDEITMLWNLVHLDTSECYFLSGMPCGMNRLQKLVLLKGYVVGSFRENQFYQLRQVAELRNLKKLSISVRRDWTFLTSDIRSLSSLTSLVSLTITWAASRSPSSNIDSSRTWGMGVDPPPNIEKLDLRCIPQSTMSRWLRPSKLSKLQRLYIRGGKLKLGSLCEDGTVWSTVKVLRIRFLQGASMEVHSAFPSLDYLEFHKCTDPELNYRWTRSGDGTSNIKEENKLRISI